VLIAAWRMATGSANCYVVPMANQLSFVVLCLAFVAAPSLACSPLVQSSHETAAQAVPPRALVDETVTVACGRCIFDMKVKGCPWAAQVDGHYFLVKGVVPSKKEHDEHAADGMCNVARKAVVSGELRDGALQLSKMRLLPGPVDHKGGGHAHH
jgi:hypothetical protein